MPARLEKDETQRRRNINLADKYAKIAKKLGYGNMSEGIRRALLIAEDCRVKNDLT